MSNVSKKMLQAAAGNTGGAGLDVTDVFSTYLYDGSSSAQTITNGIDLSGEGGLVWIKERSTNGSDHHLSDTARGVSNPLNSVFSAAENSYYASNNKGITAFNNNGFTVASGDHFNDSGDTAVSWTWRKAAKFFDCITYTGNGNANHEIAHNLGTTVGWLLIKRTDSTGSWFNYHNGLSKSGNPQAAILNETGAPFTANATLWNLTYPTSTHFTVGTNSSVNASGGNYVAYLFAHNDGDGEFGPSGDQDIISCGVYSGTGSNQNINLGFEAQWVLIKPTINSNNWTIFDNMRGMPTEGLDGSARLRPNAQNAESALGAAHGLSAHASGFTAKGGGEDYNQNGNTYIYVAIRRGPLAVPEAASGVFVPAVQGVSGRNPTYPTGIVTDFSLTTQLGSSDRKVMTRLLGATELVVSDNSQEGSYSNAVWDYMNGWGNEANQTDKYSWAWKRAPSYFDTTAFSGNGTAGRTVSHNLGVAPEMMWVKVRSIVEPWAVYHTGMNGGTTPEKYHMRLTSGAESEDSDIWNNTAPTSSVFTTGGNDKVNANNQTYIAYLFATTPGVSKVGSVSHSGSSTDVNCGFSNGARFVMLKRSNASGDWYFWDSVRGIVAGNDPYLLLNTTAASVTNTDFIDPLASGFQISGDFTDGTYIFYAIA